MRQTSADIATGIRSELRSIVRMRRDLYSPVQQFQPITDDDGTTRYYVLFDMHPRKPFTGPRFACLNQLLVPDERIEGEVLAWAKAVWHLKDRLHQFAKSTSYSIDLNAYASAHPNLLVCADLANMKKHGRNENRSKLNPRLGPIQFDTSKNGSAEIYYDGAMKDKELIVSNPIPIPFRVDVLVGETDTVLGDALEVINNGLRDWLPVIKNLAVLQDDNPESKALRIILFDEGEPRAEGAEAQVELIQAPQNDEDLNAVLLRHAGKGRGLPSDLAANHDHYAHGKPKP